MDAFLLGFHREGNVILVTDDVTLEIRDGEVNVVMADVDPGEIAGIRVESVDAGAAPAGCALLAQVDDETLVDQFAEEFGDRGNAGVEFGAQVSDAVLSVFDAETEDHFFQEGVLVVFLAQECLSHCS